MKTFMEVMQWCEGAAGEFGDPSVPVCQLFFRWHGQLERAVLRTDPDGELICGWSEDELVLLLGPGFQPFPLPVVMGEHILAGPGELKAYGADKISPGVWALSPSFYPEGVIHAFVILLDVPDPAPWERRIILPDSIVRAA